MTESEADDALVVALRLSDPALAERVATILAGTPGLRLAAPDEPADLALVAAPTAYTSSERERADAA